MQYENLQAILAERKLPELLSKEEMLGILLKEEYGYFLPAPSRVEWTEESSQTSYAGKATEKVVKITSRWGEKKFTFPISVVIPKGNGPFPFFIHANFRPSVPDKYMPTEEIVDGGFAVLSFCYQDVTADNDDFTDGLCGVYYSDIEKGERSPGKIVFWAWAAQRVMDYAQTLPMLDQNRSVICGHSRLGKTALVCGATDERFKFVYSNDSGCNGAAITRDKVGEKVADSIRLVPYWYCDNYKKYVNRASEMPFDQHYLLASIAPRYLYVASAVEDEWADPDSEMLGCVAATPLYNELGLDGLVCEDRLPKVGDTYHDGHIGYHLRAGEHFFSREDWQKAMAFIKKKSK